MKDKVMVNHGKVTHPAEDRYDCMECLDAEIDFLQALKDAGGQTKFIKKLKEDYE